jgi:hypothetical protein
MSHRTWDIMELATWDIIELQTTDSACIAEFAIYASAGEQRHV